MKVCVFEYMDFRAYLRDAYTAMKQVSAKYSYRYFAQKAGVGRLVLFHHDPDRSDAGVDRLVQQATELWNGNGGPPPVAACEGMTIDVG